MSKNQMIPNKVITFIRRIARDKKLVIVQSKKARQII